MNCNAGLKLPQPTINYLPVPRTILPQHLTGNCPGSKRAESHHPLHIHTGRWPVLRGKPGEALLSILVEMGGLYFGVTNFLAGYYLSAWGVGAATFGSFHSGGIRRAEVLVKQYNARQAQQFNAKVKSELLKQVSQ